MSKTNPKIAIVFISQVGFIGSRKIDIWVILTTRNTRGKLVR